MFFWLYLAFFLFHTCFVVVCLLTSSPYSTARSRERVEKNKEKNISQPLSSLYLLSVSLSTPLPHAFFPMRMRAAGCRLYPFVFLLVVAEAVVWQQTHLLLADGDVVLTRSESGGYVQHAPVKMGQVIQPEHDWYVLGRRQCSPA